MTRTTPNRAARVLSLALGGHTTEALPNRWDGYDLDLEDGTTLRLADDLGLIEVFTFAPNDVLLTKASFSYEAPPAAVAAYVAALLAPGL